MKRFLPIVILLTGCASFRSTPVDKQESLTRYETSDSGQLVTTASGRTIRLKPSGRLSMVTAWVLAGDEVDAEQVNSLLTGAMAGNPAPASAATPVVETPGGMGGAVAIAPDGYFLTTAHGVAFRSCWAAYVSALHPVTFRFVKAREIFADPAADLAVIKIEMATPRYLEIQDLPAEAKGTVVFSGHLGTQPSAGEIMATQELRLLANGSTETYQRLKIQIPIMPGDSGAPVVDQRGRLRGIITEEIFGLGWKLPHRAYAIMPSRAFIATLIAQDRAKSSTPNH
jgi:S1-C subfamily serine protease